MPHAARAPDDSILIPRRYRGPPDSANGGYASGLLGVRHGGTARVRLHVPPPLMRPLTIRSAADGKLVLQDGERLIAESTDDELELDVPEAVSVREAEAAMRRFRGYGHHPFPGCFVCGPERHAGDALCIHPGKVEGRQIVAAPWRIDRGFCDRNGTVRPEIMWAALDCPSWFGLLELAGDTTVALLGQLTAAIYARPAANEDCVVLGWGIDRDGRKLHGGSAIYGAGGTLLGASLALWIQAREYS